MATIKTQGSSLNLKVITKDGKVSCTCCCLCNYLTCVELLKSFRNAIRPATRGPQPRIPLPPTIDINYIDPSDNINKEITGTFTYHGLFGTMTPPTRPAPICFYERCRGYRRKGYCLRFLCRIVNDQSNDFVTPENQKNGIVLCSTVNCGPSVNQKNLTQELFNVLGERQNRKNLLSVETQSGIYIYCFEFFGWVPPIFFNEGRVGTPYPSDSQYDLYSFFNNLE